MDCSDHIALMFLLPNTFGPIAWILSKRLDSNRAAAFITIFITITIVYFLVMGRLGYIQLSY